MYSCDHEEARFRIIHPLRGVSQGRRELVARTLRDVFPHMRRMAAQVVCLHCAGQEARFVRMIFGRTPAITAVMPLKGYHRTTGSAVAAAVAAVPPLRVEVAEFFRGIFRAARCFLGV